MKPVRDRWRRRAADAELNESQRTYALRRAESLRRPYYEREDACGDTGTEVKCGCWVDEDPKASTPPALIPLRMAFNGHRKKGMRDGMVRWHACRRHLTCPRCRAARSVKYGAKIRDALEVNLELGNAHPARRGRRRPMHVVMMTIALRHTGDVDADRKELALCWRRFRDAYAHAFGRFAFVGVYEVTPGRDGLGHVHAHVLCLWPRGRAGDESGGDWVVLRQMWLDAARGQSERVNFKASERCGDAAGYVSKYVAKGISSSDFTPELSARVASATYNTRWVFTSRGFWLPFEGICRSCGCKVESVTFSFSRVEAPPSPAPPDWSTGPPVGGGRYQQASFTLPEPHECGRASRARRRSAVDER
jgi:hypothetical protein